MSFDHDSVVSFATSWGLIYFIMMAVGVLVYVFWPSNKKRFDDAKKSILDEDDEPWKK